MCGVGLRANECCSRTPSRVSPENTFGQTYLNQPRESPPPPQLHGKWCEKVDKNTRDTNFRSLFNFSTTIYTVTNLECTKMVAPLVRWALLWNVTHFIMLSATTDQTRLAALSRLPHLTNICNTNFVQALHKSTLLSPISVQKSWIQLTAGCVCVVGSTNAIQVSELIANRREVILDADGTTLPAR